MSVEVYSGQGFLDAESVRIFLESAGIQAIVTQESVGQTYGLTMGPLGAAHVWVSEENAEEALRLIQGMEDGSFMDEPELLDEDQSENEEDPSEDE